MDEMPSRLAPDAPELPEDDPRLGIALGELRRALEAASGEDRAFLLGQLEGLARRFEER